MIVFLVEYARRRGLKACDFERAFYYAAYAFIDDLRDEGAYNSWSRVTKESANLEKIAQGFTLAGIDSQISKFTLNYIQDCLNGKYGEVVLELETYLKYYINKKGA